MRSLNARPLVPAFVAAGAAFLLSQPLGQGPLRFEVGGFEDSWLGGDWGRSDRLDLDPQATTDGVTTFYYRPSGANATLRLPLNAPGGLRLTLRGRAAVRSGVAVIAGNQRAGEVLVGAGQWSRYSLELPPVASGPLELKLALRPLPLVKGAHAEDPHILVDYLELESETGLRFDRAAAALVALQPLLGFGFCIAIGTSAASAGIAAVLTAVLAVGLVRLFPFATILALPRLVPLALVTGWLGARLIARFARVSRGEAAALGALVAAGVLSHGSLVFFPNHYPPDIDIHVRRTLDLGGVPLDYQALLRYGSQLPTASQDQGQATAALGAQVLIPYSPLPYVFYYAAHRLGLDLYWAMTALNAALLMLVAPAMFLAARRQFGAEAGWLAALLYSLDLSVWHHLGRSHAPAAFGGALATAALLLFVGRIEDLDDRGRAVRVGLALAVGALGYSSSVVQLGLFGVALLLLLAADARALTPAVRRGAALALLAGGLGSGLLFYFHYVPGLVMGVGGVEAAPDAFPGKAFFIFHNESRQSLRLWALGLAWPLGVGLAAAPFALARARPGARPVLIAWLAAWALVMVLKEPAFFPKLLRWGKEDQFLAPLLCLLTAGACTAPRRRERRVGLGALALLGALLLELRDFRYHADSLSL
jgi:hypothetical protein